MALSASALTIVERDDSAPGDRDWRDGDGERYVREGGETDESADGDADVGSPDDQMT